MDAPPDSVLPADPEQDSIFVQEMLRHGDGLLACTRAGFRDLRYPIEVVARRQLERPAIAAAIAALARIESSTAPVEITRQSIAADMQAVFQKAIDMADHRAAVAAKKLQAEILGLLDKKVMHLHRHAWQMSSAELETIARQGDQKTIEAAYHRGDIACVSGVAFSAWRAAGEHAFGAVEVNESRSFVNWGAARIEHCSTSLTIGNEISTSWALNWGLFPVGDWPWRKSGPFVFCRKTFDPQPLTSRSGLRRGFASIASHARLG